MKFLRLQVALASLLGIVYVYASPNLNDSPTVNAPSPIAPPCFQPNTSSDPSKWSTDEYIKDNMKIPTNSTPIFWMGHIPNFPATSVLSKAQDCATKNPSGASGVTIGMVMCQNNFVGPPIPPPPSVAEAADRWNHFASLVYANRTSGVAWTIAGDFPSTSDYLLDQFPTLARNNVTAVLGIHSDTCEPFCYWYCPRGSEVSKCKVGICFSPHNSSIIELTNFTRISLLVTSFVTPWALGPRHLLYSNLHLSLVQATF